MITKTGPFWADIFQNNWPIQAQTEEMSISSIQALLLLNDRIMISLPGQLFYAANQIFLAIENHSGN